MSPAHKKILATSGDLGHNMPARSLTPFNPRLKFKGRLETPDMEPIPAASPHAPSFTRASSTTSPWKNRVFATKKMAEIREKHTVYYVIQGGHAAGDNEESSEEDDEEGACVRQGEEASLDHHALYGAVRTIIKDNDKKAQRMARKRSKQSE